MNITYEKIVEAKNLINKITERVYTTPDYWKRVIGIVAKKDVRLAKAIHVVITSGNWYNDYGEWSFYMPATSCCMSKRNRTTSNREFRKGLMRCYVVNEEA